MQLIFEKSVEGRNNDYLPECDVPVYEMDKKFMRESDLNLPEIAEADLSRHYTSLANRTFGVNKGFYPLGSCTMKYNPKINEEMAGLEGFANIHPLQPENTVQGCLEALHLAEEYLNKITGMDAISFQPAAGAHGEYTGLKLIKAYHDDRGDFKRDKIIVPDSAHGTNPASAAMLGYKIINIKSSEDGFVDLAELEKAVGDDTAGFMLTNPNTLGLFDPNILKITEIVRKAGGLNYYDGANLNAIMGRARPGDMGFDVVHLNLHKTFSTPHGGGGPGAGPVGCKGFLKCFLPGPVVVKEDSIFKFFTPEKSIGRVKSFYGHFLVVVKALTYILQNGCDGLKEVSESAVLNANYMMYKLKETYNIPYKGPCMHEFVISLEEEKAKYGFTALDIAKALVDKGMHPPTMYFPLVVHEALMVEPTETESKETLDKAIEDFIAVYEQAKQDVEKVKNTPVTTPVGRPDEATAARNPIIKYEG